MIQPPFNPDAHHWTGAPPIDGELPQQVSDVDSSPTSPTAASTTAVTAANAPQISGEADDLSQSADRRISDLQSRHEPPTLQQLPMLRVQTAGSQVPLRSPRSASGLQPAAPPARSSGSSALGQSLFFLFAMATMLAAARFIMPTIVEEARYAWYRGELRAQYEASGDGLKNVSLGALSEAYQMVTQHVGPSVVHIEVQRDSDSSSAVAKLLGTSHLDTYVPLADQGSGVVVDADGYVMTNYHVIADGHRIMVGLSDGRRVPATVVGIDALTDLALLKVSADRLFPIRWGDSDRSQVGAPVWAVGSPFGLDRTVTFGILSGKHRMVKASSRYQDFMQSDAAINPGNSGGPLVDAQGELIGINTAIVGDTFRGVSFSIPSNVAKAVYERLRATGRFDRGWLGLALSEVPDELVVGDNLRVRGALVTGLAGSDSPAARGGTKPGDIILRLDDQPIKDVGHLMRVAGNLAVNTRIILDVQRGPEAIALEVTIGSRPDDVTSR
jgi:serine protease Do